MLRWEEPAPQQPAAAAAVENSSAAGDEAASATRLLLNPAYSRSKSVISDELRNIRVCLRWCGLDHSTFSRKLSSFLAFGLLAVFIPAAAAIAVEDSGAAAWVQNLVQLPETALAAISFLTLSSFFKRLGLRQLLHLDNLHDDYPFVRRRYTDELDRASRYLAFILLPSLGFQLAHKLVFFFFSPAVSLPGGRSRTGPVFFFLTVAAWVYRTGVFLLVCVLFRLTCELQILRLEGLRKRLEDLGSEPGEIFEEHSRVRSQLLLTSHRYRVFIISCFVAITVSQLGALLLVLSSSFRSDFRNSGGLLVCSVVQLSGFLLCLVGAAKITHRAQRTVAVAAAWHAAATCDAAAPPEYAAVEARKALLAYLEHNSRGITVFGFALDRGLLHTLFAFEMTLVLWILSKLVVLY
ncbi:ras guanine nucleotide exchange factor K [Wolffia australiana]